MGTTTVRCLFFLLVLVKPVTQKKKQAMMTNAVIPAAEIAPVLELDP